MSHVSWIWKYTTSLILELRKYSNDTIQSNMIPLLELARFFSHFFTRSFGLKSAKMKIKFNDAKWKLGTKLMKQNCEVTK